MISIAEHKQIAGNRIAEEPRRKPSRVEKLGIFGSCRFGDAALHRIGREQQIGVAGEIAGDRFVAVDDRVAVSGFELCQGVGARRNHEIAAQQQFGIAGGDSHRVDLIRLFGDPDVAVNGTAFLRETRHVKNSAAFAFEMGGHAEQRTDCDDAGSADTGN